MIYQKFIPSEALNPYVECYFVWHSSDAAVNNLVVESPPTGYCSIVFNCGDDYHIRNKKYDRLKVPRQFISGQSIYSYSLFFDGIISLCGIVLKPTALASVFNLPTYQYTEERIDLTTVFPTSVVSGIATNISNEKDVNEKVKLLDQFLLRFFKENKPVPDYIDKVANLIIEKNGMVDVAEMMKNVFMSRRNFERKFFRKVGLSPKYYARLKRMSFIMNIIAGKRRADWGALFSECEFYDQSHFIKDFLEFTGRSPQQYLLDNQELANMVEKPTPGNIHY
jgi:AraC-like DNA-binding protein